MADSNNNGPLYILSLVAIVGIVAIILGVNSGSGSSAAPQVVTVPSYDYQEESYDDGENLIGNAGIGKKQITNVDDTTIFTSESCGKDCTRYCAYPRSGGRGSCSNTYSR